MVDSIEKFLEVQIYDKAVTRRDQFLRLLHRLMRRAARPKAVAVLGERRVPSRLQHLQRRLLDKSVNYTRNPERTSAARGLPYLDPPHRLRLVSAIKQLSPDRGPVFPQVRGQCVNGHAVASWRSLVAPDLLQRSPHVVTLDNRFHRRPSSRRAFEAGFRRSDFGLLGGGASGFTRRSGSQVQHYLIVLPLHRYEIAALIASSTVRAFGHRFRLDLSVAPPFGAECTSLTDAMAYFAVC